MNLKFDYTHAFFKGQPTKKNLTELTGELQRVQNSMRMMREIDELGFADLPGNEAMAREVAKLAKRYKDFDDVVVLGIGGSALGFIALKDALLHPFHNLLTEGRVAPRFHVLDNIDPELVGGVLNLIDPTKTLVCVITKSGSTAETVGQFLIFYDYFVAKLGGKAEANKRFVFITDPDKGPLRALANEEGIATLPVPANVGGRFSVFCPVGLFPAALAGIKINALLKGAGEALTTGLEAPVLSSPSFVGAALHFLHYQQGRRIAVMMPYANSLFRTADWFRQLWAESLGKANDVAGKPVHIGPTPLAALGATDQHSQVQLFAEGPDDKLYTFLRVEKMRRDLPYPKSPWKQDAFTYFKGRSMRKLLDAEAEATRYALTEAGRPCVTVFMPRLNEETIGRLLMHLELQTAAAGLLFNINAFDQPGVEAGKRYAFGLMGRPGYEKEAARVNKATAKPFVLEG